MTDTTIGVSAETKQKFDAAKPDDDTTDEFLNDLLDGATIRPTRYVDANAVLEAIDETRVSKQDVREAVEEAAAQR